MINKEEVKNILITRTDRLGDVILTLPLINETKKIFKSAKIFFLVKKYAAELIKGYRDTDLIITEENADSFIGKFRFLKSKKIDLVINVKPGFELALLFFMLRIKYRVGTAYRWYSFLYNYKVYEHRKDSIKHESEYNINLIRNFFKDEIDRPEIKFYLSYSEDEKKELIKKHEFISAGNYIVIHPGSGGSSRDLPLENMKEFVNIFLDKFKDKRIAFTGTGTEAIQIKEIINSTENKYRERIFDLSEKLTIRELMVLTDNSDIFISNSTGPVHIAGALNKNIIAFYPNTVQMSDTRWKPLSSNTVILKPEDNSDNMQSIKAEKIIEAAGSFLKNK